MRIIPPAAAETENAVAIDKEAFDALIASGPVAEDSEIESSEWASAVKEAGVLRVDAYVTDYTLLLNAIVKNPDAYEIAGEVFGPEDNYGIGLPRDSDGVAFVNAFLERIEEEGLWEQLWKVSLGDRTGIDTAPETPAVGE